MWSAFLFLSAMIHSISKYYLVHLPMLKLLIPAILGIILNNLVHLTIKQSAYLTIVLAVLIAVLILLGNKKIIINTIVRNSMFRSAVMLLVWFIIGLVLPSIHDQLNSTSHYHHQIEDNVVYIATIKNQLVEKKNSYKTILKITHVIDATKQRISSGLLLAYLKKEEGVQTLNVGDTLLFKRTPQDINPPFNPNQFNYKEYLALQQIAHQIYLTSQDYSYKLKKQSSPGFISALKKKLNSILKQHLKSPEEFGFANALLLGDKVDLDTEIKTMYSGTGAMHVLAVSGLHVGIIYMVFHFLLSFSQHRIMKVFRPILLIVIIWIYAFLTGSSPSVLRAATMLSFFVFGTALKRYINIYNTMMASALLLLLLNPSLLFQVSFQLSYTALLGIIFLQPKIYCLLNAENYFIDKLWALTSVSIAAQISTFPISIYYFNQFPTYFWMSNILVIPAATLLVCLGILLFAFHWWNGLASLVGFLMEQCIYFLNKGIALIYNLPFSVIEFLTITKVELLLLYLFIVTLIIALTLQSKKSLSLAMLLLLLFGFSLNNTYYKSSSSNRFIVYNVSKTSALGFITPKEFKVLFSGEPSSYQKLYDFNIQPSLNRFNKLSDSQRHFIEAPIEQSQIQFNWKGLSIVYLGSSVDKLKPITADIAVIASSKLYDLETITSYIKAKSYVFDSSFSSYKKKVWKAEAKALALNSYFVTDTSAYVVEIPK